MTRNSTVSSEQRSRSILKPITALHVADYFLVCIRLLDSHLIYIRIRSISASCVRPRLPRRAVVSNQSVSLKYSAKF